MTFDKFADTLVMSRVIAPEAISDPDNYDDSCTLENVRAAYRRLTTPTTGMTFGQAVTDLGEATAPVRLTDDQVERALRTNGAYESDAAYAMAKDGLLTEARAVEAAVLRANGFDVQPTEAGG